MTTWQDVERVRTEHPNWDSREIATELGCLSEYVRATAKRRGWKLPSCRHYDGVLLRVPRESIVQLCRDGETPKDCLRRLVHRMLIQKNAAVQR